MIDLRAELPALDRTVRLDGEWEFFWKKFIGPGRSHSDNAPRPDALAIVPSNWNGLAIDGREIGGTGFASYRLTVLLPPESRGPLAFEFKEMGTAYTIFVNGERIGSRGDVADSAEAERPSLRPGTYLYVPASPELEIILHVSNFHYRKGGIWHPIEFGPAARLGETNTRHVIAEAVLAGALLLIGLYHLIISALARGERSPVYFGFICLNIALRELVLGHKNLLSLLPALPFEVYLPLEYFTFGLTVPLFAEYFGALFPRRFPRAYIRALWIVFGVFAAAVLFTPPVFFTWLVFPYYANILAFCGYALCAVCLSSRRGNPDARLVLWPGLAMIFAGVNDIAYASKLIDTTNLLAPGLLVFMLAQALLIAGRFSRAFRKVEVLSGELSSKNTSLEAVNREITGLKDALEYKVRERTLDLELARDRAESANRAKSTFLANVSHEIRTPLNVVLGFSQLLETRTDSLSNEELEWIGHIRNAGENLLGTVNDILDISRVEAGKLKLEMAPVQVGELLAGCVQSIMPLAREKGLTVRTEVRDETAIIRGDAARLKQIFANLLSNAIKFTGDGLEIGVIAAKTGAEIRITVWDQGPGVRPQDRERIFLPFEQAYEANSGKPQGTGLGLAISSKLAELHGGRITLESRQGGGSLFHLVFPLECGAGIPAPHAGRGKPGPAPGSLRGNVLIIEDNDSILKLYHSIFERTGLNVVYAVSGEEGVLTAANRDFHLILMDMQLPGMDGIAAAREIRKTLGDRTPPIIALTAHAMTGDREHFMREGFFDYISKPFKIEDLMEKLAQIMGLRATDPE